MLLWYHESKDGFMTLEVENFTYLSIDIEKLTLCFSRIHRKSLNILCDLRIIMNNFS